MALLKSTSGAAWTIGLVTYSRAQSLLLGGKHAELRALLSAPVPLGGAPADDPAARAVQVALDGMLADSYARTGERDQAATIYRRMVRGFDALPDGQGGNGLAGMVATARRRLAEWDGQGGR